jgi:predicted permease
MAEPFAGVAAYGRHRLDRDRQAGSGVMSRLYQLLLRAYPASVRRAFGRDMAELFADMLREERQRGGRRAAASAAARTLLELPFSAWRARRAQAPPPPPSGRRLGGVEVLMQSFRHSLRNLKNNPGFAAVVVLTLAIAIGANTVVFSMVDGVLLSPLPYEDPEKLVRVYQQWPRTPPELGFLAGAAILEYRELDELFDGVGIFYTYTERGADILVGGEPERILMMPIGAGAFAALGVEPAMGREFRRDEERWDAGVAIISHGLWQRYFAGDPAVIGRSLELDGETRVIVGVMPAGFRNPIGSQPDAWVPEQLLPVTGGDRWDPNNWDNHYLSAVARLRDGVTIDQAHARLDSLVAAYEERYEWVDGQSARLVPLLDDRVGDTATMLWVLMAAVGMVLLVACVNVASLYLARNADRGKELAIRAALGARRGRLVVQTLAESLLLGMAGGLVGLAASVAGLRAVVALSPADLPRVADVGIDLRVFVFATAASLLTGLLFGAAPALRYSRPDLERVLRREDRGNSGGRSLRRLRGGLVVAEVALALALLFGAGLLTKSFANLLAVDVGVEADGVLTYEVHLPDARYPGGEERIAFYDQLFARIEAIAGVDAVGAVSFLPATGEYHQWGLRRTDIDPESEEARSGPNVRVVDGEYFEVTGMRILRGRGFAPSDASDSPGVLVVNDVLAEQLYSDRDPLGAPVRLAGRDYEIVGIVSSSARDPIGTRGPDVYLLHDQYASNRNWALTQTVRVAGDPLSIVGQLRAALREIDPRLVLYDVRTMESVIIAGISPQRFTMTLMTAFAGIGVLLAAVGIYGVLAYSVAQRSHEIGIRMALGADRHEVRVMVLRQALALTAIGVGLGIAGSLALSGWLSSMLFEVGASDPLVLAAVVAFLGATAALAAYVPAQRATKVDPLRALRDH